MSEQMSPEPHAPADVEGHMMAAEEDVEGHMMMDAGQPDRMMTMDEEA